MKLEASILLISNKLKQKRALNVKGLSMAKFLLAIASILLRILINRMY